jgi:NitT/TauT family transport system substrate-binding protein
MKKITPVSYLLLLLLAVLLVACGGASATATPAAGRPTPTTAAQPQETQPPAQALTPVRLQLQWVTQSQFAGYYAALDQGFYADEGLDVRILEGAVDIVPQQVVAAGGAEFGIAWVPKVLASRAEGVDLVNIAQIFQRSGTLQVSWADSGITSPADWRGKRVGTWGFGNEFEVFAALRKFGIDPDDPNQVTIVQQPFDMSLLLNREIDAAQAEIYNEYAQVLEAINPETGELYQPADLAVIDYNDVGTAMLQDHVFVRGDWLTQAGNEDIAVRFLRASFRGWMFCRDNLERCVEIVLANGPTLGESHMTWQLNEINALIWPSPQGIGIMDPALWQQTVDIAVEFGVINEPPTADAYRTDLAQRAHEGLAGDTRGLNFTREVVELRPGGE